MPVVVTVEHCSHIMAAVVRPMRAVLQNCSATGIKFTNSEFSLMIEDDIRGDLLD